MQKQPPISTPTNRDPRAATCELGCIVALWELSGLPPPPFPQPFVPRDFDEVEARLQHKAFLPTRRPTTVLVIDSLVEPDLEQPDLEQPVLWEGPVGGAPIQ